MFINSNQQPATVQTNLINNIIMYLYGILNYLIWPVFIIVSWFAVKAGLKYYEKKHPPEREAS
jgi:heme/copper-type cytochrome/quinol oxidase subunit 2